VEERNLGKSGLSVTLVGLGCNNFGGRIDLEATRRVVHKALDLGITLFDTADIYGEKGGEKGGSGDRKHEDRSVNRKGGRKGGRASASRPASARRASARKAARTRTRSGR